MRFFEETQKHSFYGFAAKHAFAIFILKSACKNPLKKSQFVFATKTLNSFICICYIFFIPSCGVSGQKWSELLVNLSLCLSANLFIAFFILNEHMFCVLIWNWLTRPHWAHVKKHYLWIIFCQKLVNKLRSKISMTNQFHVW